MDQDFRSPRSRRSWPRSLTITIVSVVVVAVIGGVSVSVSRTLRERRLLDVVSAGVNTDESDKSAAAVSLYRMASEKATDALIAAAIGDPDATLWVLPALTEYDSGGVLELTRVAFDVYDREEADTALDAVAVYLRGSDVPADVAAPSLLFLLRAEDPGIRSAAASALGDRAPARNQYLPQLLKELKQPPRRGDGDVVRAALRMGAGVEDVWATLVWCLEDSDRCYCDGFIEILRDQGCRSRTALPLLKRYVSSLPPGSEERLVAKVATDRIREHCERLESQSRNHADDAER